MVLDLCDCFEDVEIVFGSERVLTRRFAALVNLTGANEDYTIKDALADQKVLVEALVDHLGKAHARLLPRVLDGSLRFRMLKGVPSHEKLYLLDGGEGRRRVVTGSANLSQTAFGGRQRETILVFDDEEAFDHFSAVYVRENAEAAPIEADQVERAQHGGMSLDDTPIARRVVEGGLIIDDTAVPAAQTPWSRDALARAEREGRRLAAVDVPRDKRGKTVLNAASLKRMLAQARNAPLRAEAEERPPRVTVDLDGGEIRLDGEMLSLEPDRARAAADARLLVDYIAGFEEHFRGDVAGAIRAYWALLAWLYASPFVSFLRRAAVHNNRVVYMYPHAAVIYGKSGAGKSQFIKTVLLSMYGRYKPIAAPDFTRTLFRGLRAEVGAFPVVVDDIQQKRFTDHAVEIIKDDFYSEAPAPVVVLSANQDLRSIDTEIAKRSVICHLAVSVPQKAMFTNNRVRVVQENLGTDFYRLFLSRVLPKVGRLRAALAGEGAEDADLLAMASGELVACFEDLLGSAPQWARPLAIGDYVDVSQRKIQQKILDMVRANPAMFDIRRRRNEVVVAAGTPQEARSLQRDLHDTIIREIAGDRVVLDLRELEGFLGTRLPGGWLSRWRR